MAEYDLFAENYLTQQEHGDLASTVEYPAMTKLLGRIKGKKLLDVGCGIGRHARFCVKKGADVTVIDNAKKLLEKIQDKKIKKICHDITKKFPFENKQFEIVTCSLVLDHIKKIDKPLKEIYRVLSDEGIFYCSIPHPLFGQEQTLIGLKQEKAEVDVFGNYFYPRKLLQEYDDATITLYHRTLTDYLAAFKRTGFVLETFLEAQPPRGMKKKDVLGYAYASRNPLFLLFVLRKKN